MPVRHLAVPTMSLVLAAAVTAPAACQGNPDPDRPVQGGGDFPAGWQVRTERNAPTTDVRFAAMGDGYHVTVGPAAIYWRPADTARGNVHIVATITQVKNPEHPESFGILLGGRNLADSAQAYTYFLVRPIDGKFSIRRREGYANRPTALVEWTDHDAVVHSDSAGRATNELSILVQGARVTFLVNGTEVHSAPAATVQPGGIVGYRVNHNLDVHLGPIGIHPMGG